MRRRAAKLLASAMFSGALLFALTACVPPAPLVVAGALPPPETTYTIIGEDELSIAARAALARGLMARSMMPPSKGLAPGRLISLTLADRPRASGSVAGNDLPVTADAPGWTDKPVKAGLFTKGRREVRLTIHFFSPDGRVLEERVAHEIVTRKAPVPDMARLIAAAFAP